MVPLKTTNESPINQLVPQYINFHKLKPLNRFPAHPPNQIGEGDAHRLNRLSPRKVQYFSVP